MINQQEQALASIVEIERVQTKAYEAGRASLKAELREKIEALKFVKQSKGYWKTNDAYASESYSYVKPWNDALHAIELSLLDQVK